MALEVAVLPVTELRQNCSLVWCNETNRGALIDPGGDIEEIKQAISETGMQVERILITHGHCDHAGGAQQLGEDLSVPIEGPHTADKFWIDLIVEQGERFGMAGARTFEPDRWLQGGDTVSFGNITMDVLHCPGHTPGHVVFVEKDARLAFVGDVIFKGSIGRTDFPMGNHGELIKSIRETLFPLGDDMTFVPGHGPQSTFGRERENNPYVSDDAVG